VRSGAERQLDRAQPVERSRYLRRPVALALVGLALLIVVAVGVPLLGRALQGVDLKAAAASVQEWGFQIGGMTWRPPWRVGWIGWSAGSTSRGHRSSHRRSHPWSHRG